MKLKEILPLNWVMPTQRHFIYNFRFLNVMMNVALGLDAIDLINPIKMKDFLVKELDVWEDTDLCGIF